MKSREFFEPRTSGHVILTTRDILLNKLGEAQRQRGKRLDWIEHERATMLDVVNCERTCMRKLPILLEDIERVEKRALGHSDYSYKFALYCAELVHQ